MATVGSKVHLMNLGMRALAEHYLEVVYMRLNYYREEVIKYSLAECTGSSSLLRECNL